MPDRTPATLTDDELREIADTADAEMLPDETVQAMAAELLGARAYVDEVVRERDGAREVAEHRLEVIREVVADLNAARAQFGLLYDALAEHGAAFTTEHGRVVGVEMPTLDALRARVTELEAERAEARRIHDESPGECYHCPRCQDADESQREADRARIAELEAACTITSETSDGYHTFAELYHYRMLYNAALFNEWAAANRYGVHKSIRHADGELCFGGGWFVVYAQLPTGQISNHYEMTDWDRFRVPERERAAEWDGHTPEQVAERLAAFLNLGPGGPRFSQRHLAQVTRERDEARARIAELEQHAALAAACRPPEIHDRPTDTDLAALVWALDGTSDPAYVLGAELIEKRARVAELRAELVGTRTRITDLEERGAKQRARITQLEMWKANAETTLTEDQRYIAEANSGELVRRLGSERDAARNRITELEAQAAILADSEVERARLSLYARNARRAIRTLWESRRHWQDRVAGLEAERDGLHQAVDHRREVIREVIREMAAEIATARDRIAELEAEQPAPVAYSVIHRLPDGEVAFTNRYYLDRARADQRAADDGAAYSVVELREVSDRG
ncbi:hypothetical protein [Nocardia cyriacigeorgica]|uniref:WDGH domain-containing protein n=1 Tax=Nocardia cyriacigeorgica TaxID=135487 RepID=A0A5R8NEK4_9NOCA|nr:hypothetical protein [Nocardia cyriacigeorgica]TLF74080.1 hypothetical protein FEK34_25515 [Nocardia cyriacigeorgica]